MAMYCKAQSHNWQLQLNQTDLAICMQVFDWLTTVRKVVGAIVVAENTNVEIKHSARNDRRRPWRTLRQRRHWRHDPA